MAWELCSANLNSKLTTLNDEHMDKRLKQSELAYADTSATHASLLADVKRQLEENHTIIGTGMSEIRELGSRLDV